MFNNTSLDDKFNIYMCKVHRTNFIKCFDPFTLYIRLNLCQSYFIKYILSNTFISKYRDI